MVEDDQIVFADDVLDAAFAELVEAAAVPVDGEVGLAGGIERHARVERSPATPMVPSEAPERDAHRAFLPCRHHGRSLADLQTRLVGRFHICKSFFQMPIARGAVRSPLAALSPRVSRCRRGRCCGSRAASASSRSRSCAGRRRHLRVELLRRPQSVCARRGAKASRRSCRRHWDRRRPR